MRALLVGMESTPTVSASDRIDLSALLTRQQVAVLLGGVSDRMVRRLAQDGVIDRVRIGHRTVRYTRRSVLALIDPENTMSPAANPGSSQISGRHSRHGTG